MEKIWHAVRVAGAAGLRGKYIGATLNDGGDRRHGVVKDASARKPAERQIGAEFGIDRIQNEIAVARRFGD